MLTPHSPCLILVCFVLSFVLRPLQIVIAMSVASWYFARNKSNVGSLTVVASVGKTFVFHIGTAAFGALIVAIVEVSFPGCGPGDTGLWGSRRPFSCGLRAASWLPSCALGLTPARRMFLFSPLIVLQMIRAILTYIQKKAKESGNSVVQYIACCCACCFWCLENCIRFINKNAYVQVGKRARRL